MIIRRHIIEVKDEPYIAIDVDKLVVGTCLPCDIYIKDKGILITMFNKEMTFANVSKQVLREKGISEVFVERKKQFTI